MRKCPNCHNNVSLWTFFKPGFRKSAGPIICNTCGSTISPPWRRYNWFGLLGFGVYAFALKFFPQEKFGIENTFLYYLVLLSVLLILLLCTVYLTMPLSKKYNESLQND